MKRKFWLIPVGLLILTIGVTFAFKKISFNPEYKTGDKIDSFNGVAVYYNGDVDNVLGRNLSADGYNIGLKYQCVEFVKRYYFEYFNHKMPDSYGHAKDFFNHDIADGAINPQRNLFQYSNRGKSKPAVNDLLVFDGTVGNKYGHVAIIIEVNNDEIEIIQQNPGPFASARVKYPLKYEDGYYEIENSRILGWLRKEQE